MANLDFCIAKIQMLRLRLNSRFARGLHLTTQTKFLWLHQKTYVEE